MELIRRYHPPNAYRSPPRGPTPPAGPGLLDSGHLTHWSLAPRFRGVLSCSAGEAWRSCQPGLALLRRDVLERHPDCTGAEGMQELDCRGVSRLRLAQRRGVRGSSQFTVLFVVATVLFALGHVLLAIGFWIRNKLIEPNESWWDRSWNCVLLRFAHCRDQVEHYNCATERARQALPSTLVVGSESTANVHVGLEMSVLLKQPGLHAVFIERYNTLWHLRLGLAASFLVAGVVNLVFAICSLDVATCWRDQRSAIVTGLVGLVSLLLGRLLTRQHLTTSTNFLYRVIAAFNIGEEANR